MFGNRTINNLLRENHDGEGDDIRMEVNGGPGGDPDNPEDEDDGAL